MIFSVENKGDVLIVLACMYSNKYVIEFSFILESYRYCQVGLLDVGKNDDVYCFIDILRFINIVSSDDLKSSIWEEFIIS